MPLTITPAVQAIIASADTSNAPIDLVKLAGMLSAERQAMRGREASQDEDFGVWCEMAVMYVSPRFDGGENPWNSFFRPMSSETYQNGVTVYSPDITNATAEAVQHWSDRARDLNHPVLKARYADVVWDLGRLITKSLKRDVSMARIAVDAYVDAASRRLADDMHEAFTCAMRAVDLAVKIGDRARVGVARATLLGLHREVMATGQNHLWARAYDHLLDHKHAGTTDPELTGLVADLEAVLVRASSSTKPEAFDPHAAADAARRLTKHFTRAGKNSDVRRVQAGIGKTLEEFAGLGTPMLAASFLQDSLDSYRQAGLPEEAERVRIAMQQKIRESKDEMKPFGMTFEIPKEAMNKLIDILVVDDVGQTLANLAGAFVTRVTKMEEAVAAMIKDAPLFAMVNQQILADDHVAAKVGSAEVDPAGRMLRQATQTFQLQAPSLNACLLATIARHDLTPATFIAWTNRRGVFDESKLILLAEGLVAWFTKDYIKALHVLIPQVEGALRNMVAQVGRPTTKAASTVPGVSVAINMGDILFNETTVAALGPMGPDLALHMKALYADPRGWNLRNQFAHGLLDTNEVDAVTVQWIVHSLLLIGAWNKPA